MYGLAAEEANLESTKKIDFSVNLLMGFSGGFNGLIPRPDKSLLNNANVLVNDFSLTKNTYDLYKIQRGETLLQIAHNHNNTIEALMYINPQIQDPNQIQAGDILKLPNLPSSQPNSTSNQTANQTSNQSNDNQDN